MGGYWIGYNMHKKKKKNIVLLLSILPSILYYSIFKTIAFATNTQEIVAAGMRLH